MTTLAERLSFAFEEAKAAAPYKTKSGLARHCNVKTPSVSDWFSGRTKKITYENAVNAADYLGISADWLLTGEGEPHSMSVGIVSDSEDMENKGLIGIPEYSIRFACGEDTGEPIFEELTECEKAWYRPEWFQQRLINPDNCKRFKVRGTSMEPMIWDRDTILVDCTPQEIIDGKIYAFCVNGKMKVKFLFPKVDGSILIKSFNPEVADEIILPGERDYFALIGRVRDRSGGSFF